MNRGSALSALVVVVVSSAACGKGSSPEPVQVAEPAKVIEQLPKLADLTPLPEKDLVGYFSGAYHSGGNNPAVYVDRARSVFVLMGKGGMSELPLSGSGAGRAFEAFLLDNGYAANGKPAPDTHQHVQVDGKEMVVMSTAELFPEMPADLKAHFTDPQRNELEHLTVTDGMQLVADRAPVMWAYTQTLVVQGPGAAKQEFAIDKANDAFAAFRKLAAAPGKP